MLFHIDPLCVQSSMRRASRSANSFPLWGSMSEANTPCEAFHQLKDNGIRLWANPDHQHYVMQYVETLSEYISDNPEPGNNAEARALGQLLLDKGHLPDDDEVREVLVEVLASPPEVSEAAVEEASAEEASVEEVAVEEAAPIEEAVAVDEVIGVEEAAPVEEPVVVEDPAAAGGAADEVAVVEEPAVADDNNEGAREPAPVEAAAPVEEPSPVEESSPVEEPPAVEDLAAAGGGADEDAVVEEPAVADNNNEGGRIEEVEVEDPQLLGEHVADPPEDDGTCVFGRVI